VVVLSVVVVVLTVVVVVLTDVVVVVVDDTVVVVVLLTLVVVVLTLVVVVDTVVVVVVSMQLPHVIGHSTRTKALNNAFSHLSARSLHASGSGTPLQTGVVVVEVIVVEVVVIVVDVIEVVVLDTVVVVVVSTQVPHKIGPSQMFTVVTVRGSGHPRGMLLVTRNRRQRKASRQQRKANRQQRKTNRQQRNACSLQAIKTLRRRGMEHPRV